MAGKISIKRILFIAVWLCIGGGMLTLLLAAISKKNKGTCKDYVITIKGPQNNLFIDEKDVAGMLTKAAGGKVKGQEVATLNLHQLETVLEENTWIDEAEMYFDNNDVLHITIVEKEPVARVFTTANTSFYIDSAGIKMPLSDKLSARVPVFTGFTDRARWIKADSSLMKHITKTAVYIFNNPFWMAQVAQIDITPEGNFEMVPVVGNHLVKLGNGDGIDKKFRRLMIFYQQVMSKAGFDKYKTVNVQYKGQVVVSKTAATGKIDSVQLRRNIEKLMKQSAEENSDTLTAVKPITNQGADNTDAVEAPAEDKTQVKPEHQNPNTMKLSVPSKPKTNTGDKKPVKQLPAKPKAVMQKRTAETATDKEGYN